MKTSRLFLALAIAAVVAGCASTPPPSAGPEAGAPGSLRPTNEGRRATAGEIMDAYNSGSIPDWFRPADRDAVEKLRR